LELTDATMSYGGSGGNGSASRSIVNFQANTLSKPAGKPAPAAAGNSSNAWPVLTNGAPNFDLMTADQRRAYDRQRLTRRFG
jgi:hypothetical protein